MATWTNVDKYAGAPSITYNDSTATYDSALYNYAGQLTTVWTADDKH